MANPSFFALIGAGILAFLSFYASFKLYQTLISRDGSSPGALQFIVLIFFIAGVFQMAVAAKATLDLGEACQTVIANETQTGANTTSYDYKQVCTSTQGGSEKSTNNQAFYTTMYLSGAGLFLLFVHFVIVFLEWLKDRTTRGSH